MARAPKKPESGSGADFVSSIVTDPKSVPDVMRLYGYLGASSEEGHERLYLNPDLTNYVEVPTQAILHRMTVPAEQESTWCGVFMGEEGCGADLQDGACGAGVGTLFRRHDPSRNGRRGGGPSGRGSAPDRLLPDPAGYGSMPKAYGDLVPDTSLHFRWPSLYVGSLSDALPNLRALLHADRQLRGDLPNAGVPIRNSCLPANYACLSAA